MGAWPRIVSQHRLNQVAASVAAALLHAARSLEQISTASVTGNAVTEGAVRSFHAQRTAGP